MGKYILSRLRIAVKKVKVLLSMNLNRWRIASMIGASSSKRLFSFNDRPGLRACVGGDDGTESGYESAGSSWGLHRTISYPSDQDDIDKRAELFIRNFHKQLQMERQISLELHYAEGTALAPQVSP